MNTDPNSDMYMPDTVEDGPSAESDAEDEEPVSFKQMVTETIQEHPAAYLKFRVTAPDIVANDDRKKAAAAKRRKAKATKDASKPKSTKRKINEVANPDDDEEQEKKKVKKPKADDEIEVIDSSEPEEKVVKSKAKANGKAKDLPADPEDVEITAYIFVERPVPMAPVRSASGSRQHKPTEEEKYISRGLVIFAASTPYLTFIISISNQLPCAPEEVVQEKIMWKFQTPMNSTYLSLSGEIGFASMIKQLRGKKEGTRVIKLAMPPPKKPAIEKPFWEEDDTKTFDYAELDTISTHDHVVEQRVSFDKSVAPHRESLLEKYPENNHPLFPDKRIYTDNKMNAHWELTDLKISVWSAHLARGTATLEKPPISSHFDYKSRIIPKTSNKPAIGVSSVHPVADPVAITPAPAISTAPAIPLAPVAAAGTSLLDLMMFNMLQQQQQQLRANAMFPHPPVFAAAAPTVIAAPNVAPVTSQVQSVSSAPPSPAKFQLPNVSLSAFCQRYNLNETDRERLEKLEYQPGDKIDDLPEGDWKGFAGFTSLSWRRVIEKNHAFIRDARNGLWA